jgi:hypothetical protein
VNSFCQADQGDRAAAVGLLGSATAHETVLIIVTVNWA